MMHLPYKDARPTIAVAPGRNDFEASSCCALYAPASTPSDIDKRLAAEVDAALKKPPSPNDSPTGAQSR